MQSKESEHSSPQVLMDICNWGNYVPCAGGVGRYSDALMARLNQLSVIDS